MTVLKAGSRVKSQVDDTQVVIVKAPADDVVLLIGGHPAIELTDDPDSSLSIDPAQSGGTLIGKRYAREAGDIELLVTKAGTASLTLDGETLTIKDSKPLPASD